MNGKDSLTNVAYGKANWVRYLLGGILLLLIVVIGAMFMETFKNTRGINGGIDETSILNREKNNMENDEDETASDN